jgi:glc operon protein GlcG
MITLSSLSHDDAFRMIARVKQELEKRKQDAAVAVVDPHGELIAFLRTDACRLSCIDVAINKAYTAARERGESKALGEASKREGFALTNFGELRYVSWGGGVPVLVEGRVVGAVGVSGMSEEDDIAVAKLAIELIVSG